MSAIDVVRGRESEWRNGWRTLLGAFLALTVSFNVVGIALGIFVVPMQAEMGWSRAALSISAFSSLASALLLPLAGVLIERFGPRRIAIFGAALMSVSLGLFAVVPMSLGWFAVLVAVLSVAGAGINSFVLARGVVPWFDRKLGTALGILSTGVSVSLATIVPVLADVIAVRGWRTGFLAFSALGICLALPACVVFFREPARPVQSRVPTSARPDSFAALFRRLAFWQLGGACFLAALPIGGLFGHLLPLLTDRGLEPVEAGRLGSVFAIALGLGGFANGALYDRIYPPLVAAATLLLAAAGTAKLWVIPEAQPSLAAMALVVGLIGLAPGAQGNYITYFPSRLFGVSNFARVVSLLAMAISIGFALGGFCFAAAFDHSGSYQVALMASLPLYVLSAAIFLTIRLPRIP